jgi:glutamyl-tRNA synthetase
LYNYLFAKRHGGTFILSIEDTDQKRYVEGAEDYIQESLEWLGLAPDESPVRGGDFGPYRQSERSALYRKHVDELLSAGKAYYAFDTPEDLDRMRTEKEAQGIHSPKYGHEFRMEMTNSLTLPAEEVDARLAKGDDHVIRLKVDPGHTVSFEDEVRGSVSFSSDELDDKVLLKSDGLPTYHLANVVDDHAMEISHVIRGEEWLSSTAHHVLLYQAFGWDMPTFVHLPLILKPSGKGKLSKRDGAKFGFPVFPLEWQAEDETYAGFREMGFLPAAVINFLALLGWHPEDDQEVFNLDELCQAFALDRISKSGARFDFEKAQWFNQQYILSSQDGVLVDMLRSTGSALLEGRSDDFLTKVVAEMKPRVMKVEEILTEGRFFFEPTGVEDDKPVRKKWKAPVTHHWVGLIDMIEGMEDFERDTLEEKVKDYINSHELSIGGVFPLLRVAVSGRLKGPDLFTSMTILGKEEVVSRMKAAVPAFDTIAG